ncbi:MAG: M14 family metallocarboxypeptidase, partial [Phycisphaerales bacterium]|nr:M14 family metallocarboxypeptidase [Phycisphaerales bacterium]
AITAAGPTPATPHVHHSPLAGDHIISLTVDDQQLMQVIMEEGIRPLACRPGPGQSHWLANDAQLELIDRIGMPWELLVDDVVAHVEAERRTNDAAKAEGMARGDFYASYHTYEEIHARLDDLLTNYPEHVHPADAGTSLEGRPIRGVRIGIGEAGNKPALLFNGCQHAREWVATMVPTFIADELAAGYGSDARITGLLQLVDVYVIPIVNPDGYYYTYAPGGDRYWRKNRRNNGTSCSGVDLNRNWGVDWGGPESTSGDTCSDVYYGAGAFSEPETAAIRDFVLARPDIVGHIDFHCYSQLILQPWGYTSVEPPDQQELDDLGEEMTQAILGVHGEYYPHGGGDTLLYLASGVAPDWTYGATGAFGYTIELRPTGSPGFELPPDQIRPTAEENFEAILAMMEWAGLPLDVSFPGGLPAYLSTVDETTFQVKVDDNGDPPAEGGVALQWRLDGGTWTSAPCADLGDGMYQATLPIAACDDEPEFYVQLTTVAGIELTEPLSAPNDVFTADVLTTVDVVIDDDGETDPGWAVSGDATDGQWNRGIPAGGGQRGDPPNDADGSGSCWLTDNVAGNSDVDNGITVLTSPVLDASASGLSLSYWRWFSNDFGASPDEDGFLVEFNLDGEATWSVLELVAPDSSEASGGWFQANFELNDVPNFEPTDEFRIRFTAEDIGNGSVIEAGVDGLLLQVVICDDNQTDCLADVAGDDGLVNVNDLLFVIADWGQSGSPADIDGSGQVDVGDLLLVIADWGPCE